MEFIDTFMSNVYLFVLVVGLGYHWLMSCLLLKGKLEGKSIGDFFVLSLMYGKMSGKWQLFCAIVTLATAWLMYLAGLEKFASVLTLFAPVVIVFYTGNAIVLRKYIRKFGE